MFSTTSAGSDENRACGHASPAPAADFTYCPSAFGFGLDHAVSQGCPGGVKVDDQYVGLPDVRLAEPVRAAQPAAKACSAARWSPSRVDHSQPARSASTALAAFLPLVAITLP